MKLRLWSRGRKPRVLGQWGKIPGQPGEPRTVLLLEPRDCWVGVYWDSTYVYICLLPCLPLRIQHRGSWR
jgi:hypothetical protein